MLTGRRTLAVLGLGLEQLEQLASTVEEERETEQPAVHKEEVGDLVPKTHG